MNIRTILFDYGGVLAEEGFHQGLAAIAEERGLDPSRFFDDVRRIIFDIGYVYGRCGEAEFWEAVRSRLGVDGSDEELRDEILSRFVLRPWMLDVVRDLKARGLTVAILSDQVNWLDELEARDGFFHEFDAVFNSFHHGLTKSEPEFFTLALGRLGARPGETLFIDDARSNVAVGRDVGVIPILYEDKERFRSDFHRYFPDVPVR